VGVGGSKVRDGSRASLPEKQRYSRKVLLKYLGGRGWKLESLKPACATCETLSQKRKKFNGREGESPALQG
jgi:hypothetical protein